MGAGSTFVAIDSSGLNRNADIGYQPPGSATDANLPFQFLYDINYDFSDGAKGTFPKFVDNSILFGGGTVGSSSNSTDYIKVKSTKKVDVKYIPPTSLTAITKATQSCGLTNGSSVATISSTTGIEIGNYVFGTNIPADTRVIDYVINEFVIFDKNTTGGGTQTLTFIDHRGFVKKVTGSANSTSGVLTISNGDTTNLKTDMIVIANGIEQYTGITTTGSTDTVNISPSQGIGNNSFYFYQGKGLVNDSLIQFCQPNIARCLLMQSAQGQGSNTIKVTSVPTGIIGYRVRGFQFNNDPVTIINGVDDAGVGIVTVSLTTPTINDLVEGE